MRNIRILLICAVILFFQLELVPSIDLFLVGIVLTTFFYRDKDSIVFAFLAGVLRDLYYPVFGYHLAVYLLISLIGVLLIQTLITHRSLWGFAGFSFGMFFLAEVFKYLLLLIISVAGHGLAGYATISLSEMLYASENIITQFLLSFVGYVLLDRL